MKKRKGKITGGGEREIEHERRLERKIMKSNWKSEREVEREDKWQKGGDERENICKGKYRNIERERETMLWLSENKNPNKYPGKS